MCISILPAEIFLFSFRQLQFFLSHSFQASPHLLSSSNHSCFPQNRADLTGISTEHGIRNYNKTIPKPIYGKASHSEERSTENRQKNHGYSPLPVLGFPQE